MFKKKKLPEAPSSVVWDGANPARSLEEIRQAAEAQAQYRIAWYWDASRWKRLSSRAIQFLALALTAAGGIIPIVYQIVKTQGSTLDSGPWASLCVGVAAALVGLDKAFGYSSGWTRYVLTATSLSKTLHDFRMDWIALSAAAGTSPTTEQQASMIQRAKEFVATVENMVMQETKDWATEFQSNLAQMEKDLKAQLDILKAQVEKETKEKEAATKSGAIELTVTNADKTDSFSFDVALEGPSGKFAESVTGTKVWVRINLAPGQYKLTVSAKVKAAPISTSSVVDIKPGETAKPSVTLPIA